ncbi:MAG: hypothetical protein HUU35_16715 [Armatimonadetes bacterium]|nr:hypothetical protein [Armatimonadota bacterium]
MRALIALILAALPVSAHWEAAAEPFGWADPGALRWLIDYSKMDAPHVKEMVESGFNLLQGGSFTPLAREFLDTQTGVRRMQYICSRTIYHELLFPKYPELKEAAILNPDGSYKVIYNNPARYAGCWNREPWIKYIEGLVDNLEASGVRAIFFDNPMTWACYCPTCQELFTAFARERTGQAATLGQAGQPTELEQWFTIETAVRFWRRIHAHARAKSLFIVANNLTYWLVNQGLTDGVFTEGWGHPPFEQDIAAYKIGLAASHGRPTGVLDYIPVPVRQARGRQEFNASRGSGTKWVGAPVAEEYELGYAQGLACGGNYLPNYSLELGRRIELRSDPEDDRIMAALARVNRFHRAHPEVYTGREPASSLALYYDLTAGPRAGEILGLNRGKVNQVLWSLVGAGLPTELIVADDLTPERLRGIRAIILSGVDLLEPVAARALAEFTRGGGTLVLAGAVQVRERFATTPESLAGYLPGVTPLESYRYGTTDFATEGYEPAAPYLKVTSSGRATVIFAGQPGVYTVTVSYLDEDDGQGEFELRRDDQLLATWRSDADDNHLRTRAVPEVALKPGQRLTVVGKAGGGEYARLSGLRVDSGSATDWVETGLGQGRVMQHALPLQSLPAPAQDLLRERLRPLATVRGEQWPAKLLLNVTRGRTANDLAVHLVNYDLRYGEAHKLERVVPTGPLTLRVPASCRQAVLLTPEAADQPLPIAAGTVTVPSVGRYSVVQLR